MATKTKASAETPTAVLNFDNVAPLLEYASKLSGITPYTGEPRKEPGIYLVKDQGIYLMPSNTAGLTGSLRARQNHHLLIYAQDPHNPNHKKAYSRAAGQAAVGGDDFVELLDLPPKQEPKGWPNRLTILVFSKKFEFVWGY